MATIQMTGGTFTVCPEGKHIFRIYKVDFNQDFGKVVVYMVNAQGITHRENFGLMRADGSMNDAACNAFSYFARTALNDYSREAIDHTELVGRYIGAEVVHTVQPNRNDPTKTVTFANLVGEKWVEDTRAGSEHRIRGGQYDEIYKYRIWKYDFRGKNRGDRLS